MYNQNQEKAALRRKWKEVRAEIPKRSEKSRRICEKVLEHPAVLGAKTVFLYLSFGTEVETLSLAAALIERGKRVAVPLCDTKTRRMQAVLLPAMTCLREGSYGILEPDVDAKAIPQEEIEVILVPALAFDKAGYRLGYGGGYYDKFLEGFSGRTIGLAFLDCVTDSLPREEFDKPVDEVITES